MISFLFWEVGADSLVMVGGGMTVLKKFIRMRKVEIGEKFKKLLNQRLRIHPSHLK